MSTKHILVYTGGYRPDHVARDVPLAQELRARGHDVTYCIGGPALADPGHPREVACQPRLAAAGALWVNSLRALLPGLLPSDVLVVGIIAKGTERVVALAKAVGIPSVQHDDIIELAARYFGADWVCCAGDYFAQDRRGRIPLPDERTIVTGSVHADRAQGRDVKQITKLEFCQKYSLDPAKRIAVWLPSSPQGLDDWTRRKYQQVCEAIRDSPNHSLVIKPHPSDYLKRKSEHYLNGKHSWEALTPWATVVQPEDAYACYCVSDVGVSIDSTVSVEFPLFHKPFIYVDTDKSPLLATFRPNWRFKGIVVPSLVGMYCSAEQLGDVLEKTRYEIQDQRAYEDHVARFFYKNDGLAYRRIADVVERVAKETPRSSGRYRMARGSWLLARQYTGSLSRAPFRLARKRLLRKE